MTSALVTAAVWIVVIGVVIVAIAEIHEDRYRGRRDQRRHREGDDA